MNKKSLSEIIDVINNLELDNKEYIDNSGLRWLNYTKNRIARLYGLTEREIRYYIGKEIYLHEDVSGKI